MTIVYAVDDESADARIEWLIAHHPNPKTLTVVSSDHRIRQAATRRKAQALTAEAFLDQLDAHKHRKRPEPPRALSPEEIARQHGLPPEESARWEEAFRDLVDDPATQSALPSNPVYLTDEEIAEIEREIEGEL
jgi:predicted RNA-binding protein with PIN domain